MVTGPLGQLTCLRACRLDSPLLPGTAAVWGCGRPAADRGGLVSVLCEVVLQESPPASRQLFLPQGKNLRNLREADAEE